MLRDSLTSPAIPEDSFQDAQRFLMDPRCRIKADEQQTTPLSGNERNEPINKLRLVCS